MDSGEVDYGVLNKVDLGCMLKQRVYNGMFKRLILGYYLILWYYAVLNKVDLGCMLKQRVDDGMFKRLVMGYYLILWWYYGVLKKVDLGYMLKRNARKHRNGTGP